MYSQLLMAQTGDKTARDSFFENNFGLVKSIAKRFIGRGTDFEDLCQIGAIGLIKAIERFDVSSNNSFSTYAVPLITGEIKRFLRDDGMIKVSRSVKELGIKAKALYQKLEKENKEISLSALADSLGVTQSELLPALDCPWDVFSLNDKDCDGREKINTIPSETGDIDTKIFVEDMMNKLSMQDRTLVKLRYFEGKTQSEISKVLGISQVQVSRREKNILRFMRESVM